jgi:hypothetical protein
MLFLISVLNGQNNAGSDRNTFSNFAAAAYMAVQNFVLSQVPGLAVRQGHEATRLHLDSGMK